MGMIRIEMVGSFPKESFETTAEEGGHVQALSRAISFLTSRLGYAAVQDATLTVEGVVPPLAPLGQDRKKGEVP